MAPSFDSSTLADASLCDTYRAWSEQKHRWVTMTFIEYQAWLARPDLDPGDVIEYGGRPSPMPRFP